MKHKFLLVLLLFIIGSCKTEPAEYIIPEDQLIDLLIDMHIADATASYSGVSRQHGQLDSALLYNSVFEKHGCTKDDMIRSISHYAAEPREIRAIFDEVYARLSTESEETKELFRSTSLSTTHKVWKPEKNKYFTRGDSIKYPPPFDFAIDTFGNFVLSIEIKMKVKDESVNPKMVAYFYNPVDDSPDKRIYFDTIKINKSPYKRNYALIKENRNRDLNRVKIVIPVVENNDTSEYNKDFLYQNLRLSLIQD